MLEMWRDVFRQSAPGAPSGEKNSVRSHCDTARGYCIIGGSSAGGGTSGGGGGIGGGICGGRVGSRFETSVSVLREAVLIKDFDVSTHQTELQDCKREWKNSSTTQFADSWPTHRLRS
jgi:hypothetical protein